MSGKYLIPHRRGGINTHSGHKSFLILYNPRQGREKGYNTSERSVFYSINQSQEFRRYIEDHYEFGDFALIRGREETAEIGFVFADEDAYNWPSLYKKPKIFVIILIKTATEEGLKTVAYSRVGKD